MDAKSMLAGAILVPIVFVVSAAILVFVYGGTMTLVGTIKAVCKAVKEARQNARNK